MFVLRHIANDETEWVVAGGFGVRFELDGLIFHLFDTFLVFRFGFREEICLETARGGGLVPTRVGCVHVHGDEQVALCVVCNFSAIAPMQ